MMRINLIECSLRNLFSICLFNCRLLYLMEMMAGKQGEGEIEQQSNIYTAFKFSPRIRSKRVN